MQKQPSIRQIVQEWLDSRIRSGKISRNTIAVGIVVLDKLLENCPLTEDIFSLGGELKGSRTGLSKLWVKYQIPEKFLKEATTRQAHQDARMLVERLDWGKPFVEEVPEIRERELIAATAILVAEAHKWLSKQPIKINCDRQLSPSLWISSILEKARGRSRGIVEQHLIGAKLQKRHPSIGISNQPSHAGDFQTKRSGDFSIDSTSYHITATDGKEAVQRCKENVESGIHPVLLVPKQFLERAKLRAENAEILARITVLSIEDFVVQNLIEMSNAQARDYFSVLQDIIIEYNRRLEEVETDMSLKIELT
jgi:Domain of unknown function (DUF4928)